MRIEEIFAALFFISCSIFFFFLNETPISFWSSVYTTFRYLGFAVNRSEVYFFLIALFVFILFIFIRLVLRYFSVKSVDIYLGKPLRIEIIKKNLFDFLRAVIVLLVTIIPTTALSAKLNIFLSRNTDDLLFWRFDELLFGIQPFLNLTTLIQSDYMVHFLWYSYASLSLIMAFMIIFLFIVSRKYLFRIFLIAPIIAIFLSWPFFINYPCLDPGNNFIRNVGKKEFSSETHRYIQNEYKPTPLVVSYTSYLQDRESSLYNEKTIVPISCFPSMHAVWGIICVITLALYNRRLLFVLIPWLFFMLLGGLLFAQHYLIDYIVAIPFALISFFSTYFLIRKENRTHGISNEIHDIKKSLIKTFLP